MGRGELKNDGNNCLSDAMIRQQSFRSVAIALAVAVRLRRHGGLGRLACWPVAFHRSFAGRRRVSLPRREGSQG